jgi:hypothetical protein
MTRKPNKDKLENRLDNLMKKAKPAPKWPLTGQDHRL